METKRSVVQGMENILRREFKVLDKGLIVPCEYMGSDETIANCARTSYQKGTKQISDNQGLIRYLMRHLHSTPIEMNEIMFYVETPLYVWAQWIRHRTATVNQESLRYSVAQDKFIQTEFGQWRLQSISNKQGSDGHLDAEQGKEFTEDESSIIDLMYREYERRINAGVAREQARKDLPQSLYTRAYWKIDLWNLLHFCYLRMAEGAQWEIRQYANIIGNEILAKWVPITWQAFQDYRLNSISLTAKDIDVIQALKEDPDNVTKLLENWGWLTYTKEGKRKKHRERSELEAKMEKLGMEIPWK